MQTASSLVRFFEMQKNFLEIKFVKNFSLNLLCSNLHKLHTFSLFLSLFYIFFYRIIWSSFFKPSPSNNVTQAIFKPWTPRSVTRCPRLGYLLKKSQVFQYNVLTYTNGRYKHTEIMKKRNSAQKDFLLGKWRHIRALAERRETQSPRQQCDN